jgi:hypothetical protein
MISGRIAIALPPPYHLGYTDIRLERQFYLSINHARFVKPEVPG